VSAGCVVAVDVGGTSVKTVVVDAAGGVLHSSARATPVAAGPAAVVQAVRAAAGAACAARADVVAVAAVVPGHVDEDAGVARWSANLGWRDVPLRSLLAADLGVPVVVSHDVAAAGVAERTIGAARGVADCLLVVIGTGIAAVVVSGGHEVDGATGLAGELGHLVVVPHGEPCACGQDGCLEVYASAGGISRRYERRAGGPALGAAPIAERLGADPVADSVWAEATGSLATALAAATMLLDPDLIVLGGGLSEAGPALRDPVRAALADRMRWRPAPSVELSPLGGRAGALGAAVLAWRSAGRTDFGAWVSSPAPSPAA
jgi:glucokinase